MNEEDIKLMNEECNKCNLRMCSISKSCIYKDKKLNYDLPLDKKFENYVYFNLSNYGNCYIGEKEYLLLGEDNIKNDIIKNGFLNPTITKLEGFQGAIITIERRIVK